MGEYTGVGSRADRRGKRAQQPFGCWVCLRPAICTARMHQWVVSLTLKSLRVWVSHVTYVHAASKHTRNLRGSWRRVRRVCINELCVPHRSDSCHTYEWAQFRFQNCACAYTCYVLHLWVSRVTYMNVASKHVSWQPWGATKCVGARARAHTRAHARSIHHEVFGKYLNAASFILSPQGP